MKRRTELMFLMVLVPALAIVYFIADARYVSIFPRCPFNYVTGLFCPGCGTQRALSALLHGSVGQAIHFNALMVASLPLLLYSGTIRVANQFYNKQLPQPLFYSNLFVKIVLATVLLFWLLRNLPVYPFNLMAPAA